VGEYKLAQQARKERWTLETIHSKLAQNDIVRPAKSISVDAYKSFIVNENVLTRPMFLAGGGSVAYGRTSICGAAAQAKAIEMFPGTEVEMDDEGSKITVTLAEFYENRPSSSFGVLGYRLPPRAEIFAAAKETFFVASGTQAALGRVMKATNHGMQKITSVSKNEAMLAWKHSGWKTDVPAPDVLLSPWPLRTDEAEEDLAVVKVSSKAGLGLPVCGKGSDPVAVDKAIRIAGLLLRDEKLRTDPKIGYRRLCVISPGIVAMTAKAKTDAYKREKIDADMLRLYGMMPAGPRMLFGSVTAPLSLMKATLTQGRHVLEPSRYDVPLPYWAKTMEKIGEIRSSQGIAPTGEGAELIVASLDSQLYESGFSYLTHGDDMIFVLKVRLNGILSLFVVNGDGSNFDLTQTAAVNHTFIDMMADELAAIEPVAGNLWRNMMKERLVVLAGGATVWMKGAMTSGMPKVSEINDLVAQVFAIRFSAKLANRFVGKGADRALSVDPRTLETEFKAVGDSLGLSMKFENPVLTQVPDDVVEDNYLLRNMMIRDLMCLDFIGHRLLGATIRTNAQYYPPIRETNDLLRDDLDEQSLFIEAPGADGDYWMSHVSKAIVGIIVPERIVEEMQYGPVRWETSRTISELKRARTTACRLEALAPWAMNRFVGSSLSEAVSIVATIIADVDDGVVIDDDAAMYDFAEDKPVEARMTAGELKEMVARISLSIQGFARAHSVPPDSHVNPSRRLKVPLLPSRIALPAVEIEDPVGLSWADMVEADDEAAVAATLRAYFPDHSPEDTDLPGNPVAGLARATTAANFGRPAPSVAVRHTITGVTGTRDFGQKLSKGARRRKNKAARKAKADRSGYDSDAVASDDSYE
jgi:hypothetical protein